MRIVTLAKETSKIFLENLLKGSPGQYGEYESSRDRRLWTGKRKEGCGTFFLYGTFDEARI